MFKLGSTNIGELYVGSTKIGSAYLGSTKVYEAAPSLNYVQIGNQKWLDSNLSIDDGGSGIVHQDNVTINGVNFGTQYYYTRDAATRIANTIAGWHLPSYNEMQTLTNNYGSNRANALRSTSGWSAYQGTNTTGFNAIPLGYYSGSYDQRGSYACFVNSSYVLNITQNGASYSSGNLYYSVRLVKDA